MIAEFLMERFGWNDVWYLGSNCGPTRKRWWNFIGPSTFGDGVCMVGIWTGPDHDLLCVKRCESNEEAELHLSPSGWSIGHAAIRSWLKLRKCRQMSADVSTKCRQADGEDFYGDLGAKWEPEKTEVMK